jgi:hypothetical protein
VIPLIKSKVLLFLNTTAQYFSSWTGKTHHIKGRITLKNACDYMGQNGAVVIGLKDIT